MLPSIYLTILAALLVVQVNAHTHEELSQQYTYNVQLDRDGHYTMFYSYNETSSVLRFAVRVQTTGWIGLGISPNGQMPGSDVVMGWVDQSGTAFLQDRYAFARTIPSYDASQDWELTGANEEGGFTTLQFERKLDTCDPNDRAINFGDTTYLIYSYHTQDPVDNEQFLQHQFFGSFTINLFGQPETLPSLPDGVQHLDIVNNNVSVPSKDTTYLCTTMELPQFIQDKTHYILQFSPEISPDSARHVHHINVYLCEGMNLTGHPDVGVSYECDGITEEIQPCRFSTIIGGWAVGGTGHRFPEGVALPIGGEDKIHTHVLLEMHYDNPEERSGIFDSSGIRLYFTDQPPRQNAGIMIVGHLHLGHMIVPPHVERYTITGHCPQKCTDAFLPQEGITVHASLLHTHTVGEGLILRHIRNGVELDPIDVNLNYDFDFQQVNYIPRVQLLPGDEMLLECVYDSSGRNFTTFGGESTKEEMCLAYLYYYPATNLSSCLSFVSQSAYEEWLNEYVPSEHHDIINVAAANNITDDVREIFDSLDWSEDSYRLFETIGLTGLQVQACSSSTDQHNSYTEPGQPITVQVPLEQTDNCVTEEDGSGSTTTEEDGSGSTTTEEDGSESTTTEEDGSGSTTLYGSILTMMLCWMVAMIIY